MQSSEGTESREFRSLKEFQSQYFPEMEVEVDRTSAQPRQVGARLARQVLTEVLPSPPTLSNMQRKRR